MKPMLSVTEAAHQLNVHPATIRRMIQRGELPAKRVGRVYRVDPADIQPERHTMPGTSTQTGARIITSPIARLILRGSSRTTQTPRRPAGES